MSLACVFVRKRRTRRKRSRTLGRGRGTLLEKGSPSPSPSPPQTPPFPLPRLSTGGEAARREFVPAQVGKIALRTRKPSEESSGGFCFWEGWRRGMKPSFPLEPVGGEGLLPTGKHGGRDSIKLKVFEEDGGGLEGEGETFSRKFPLPSPNGVAIPTPTSSFSSTASNTRARRCGRTPANGDRRDRKGNHG